YLTDPEALFAEESRPPAFDDLTEQAVWEPLHNLLGHCLFRPVTAGPEKLLAALIGLGPGLTPLADDILCGLLAGGHALCEKVASPALRRLTETIAPAAAKATTGATTLQSAAFLESAAAGEHFGMLDAVLAAFALEDSVATQNTVDALLGVGHTSGPGMLLGLFIAVQLALPGRLST
ncbi:DUF2877 domain-containing protein, partial [Desulfovibrio sp. OttesenSCG-928-O18]|nr:DUF2877 domain-containing protein [Desulfovibrio sp. OttesenSCG-928-O18]